jgi:hypothetical protein
MPRYSEDIKVHVHRRMIPPHLQSLAANSLELGIHLNTPYKWRKIWRLQGYVVPVSQKGS